MLKSVKNASQFARRRMAHICIYRVKLVLFLVKTKRLPNNRRPGMAVVEPRAIMTTQCHGIKPGTYSYLSAREIKH